MRYFEATEYERRRLNQCKCVICDETFDSDKSFIMIKKRKSRSVEYDFIHSTCLNNSKNVNFTNYILNSSRLEVKH